MKNASCYNRYAIRPKEFGDAPELQSEQQAVSDLRRWAERFVSFAAEPVDSEAARHHLVWSLCHEGVAFVARASESGVAEDVIHGAIAPAIAIQRLSPFARRLHDWPRGYPGDFETIEYLCRQVNGGTAGTVGWYVEQMLLNTPIAQQHRNKVAHQAALLGTLAARKSDARVLVVASGSAPDVRQALPWLQLSQMRLVLNDIDPEAIAFCQCELSSLGDRAQFVQGNALRCVNRLRAFGPFDLVLCGGLCDYLTDRQVAFLLQHLERLLARDERARLFFTNIVTGNPYRLWMEYFANWRLIERDADDLQRLVSDARLQGHLFIERDPTGLAWLASYAPQDSRS